MNRRACPKATETLTSFRRGRVDASIASHVETCAACEAALAADRALALVAAVEDAGPFPSAAVLRLESELRREEERVARRGRVLLGLHAGALVLSLALLAAVRLVEMGGDARSSTLGGTGSLCAIVVVAISIWNLFRTADESAVPS
jgi:anti-sigma factor RsiW